MSTQPTEAHADTIRQIGQLLAVRADKEAAQLLADSEARAVEDAVTAIIEKNAPEIIKTNAAFTTLETELATAKAEAAHYMSIAQKATDELVRLRAELERFTCQGLLDCHAICDQRDAAVAERDRLRAEAAEMSAQRSHNANQAGRLRAEVERLKGMRTAAEAIMTDVAEANEELAIARAEKAEAEAERLTKQIKDDNRSYGCELRDPNGTIWEQAAKDHARAERAEEQLALKNSQCERAERAAAGALAMLREALEKLRDEQNGAPLCTRETEWKEAMDTADAALAATKEAASHDQTVSTETYLNEGPR